MKITKVFFAALFTIGLSNVAFAQTTPSTPSTPTPPGTSTPGTTTPGSTTTPGTTPGTMGTTPGTMGTNTGTMDTRNGTMGTNNGSMSGTPTTTDNMNQGRRGTKHKSKMSHGKGKMKTSPKY